MIEYISYEYNVTVEKKSNSKPQVIVEPDLTKIGDTENFSKRPPVR